MVIDFDIIPSPTFLQNHIETMSQNYMSNDRPQSALKRINESDLLKSPLLPRGNKSEWNGSPGQQSRGYFK